MMGSRPVLVLNRTETEDVLDPKRLLDRLEHALTCISDGLVSAPPRIAAQGHGILLGAMPGYVPDMGMAAKLVSITGKCTTQHRPIASHRGLVALFDPESGDLLAVINGTAITEVRTAATATLAMHHLAPTGHHQVSIIGTGAQARAQIRFLRAIGHTGTIAVGSRDPNHHHSITEWDTSTRLTTIRDACRDANVIFCCTDARLPVINRDWVRTGTHLSSVGGSKGPEVGRDTLAAATVFAEWPGAAEQPPPAGAHELQGMPSDRVTLLGDVLSKKHPGRSSPTQLTVFKSTGHAALDVAAAAVAYECALTREIGAPINFET